MNKSRNIRRTIRYYASEIEKIEKAIRKGKFKDFSSFARSKTLV